MKQLHTALRSATLCVIAIELARYIKIQHIIGSYFSFFSVNQCLTPLIGASEYFFGTALLFFCFRLLFQSKAQSLLLLLVYHIPSLCGSIAFSNITSSTVLKRIGLGTLLIACTLLFLIHPVGSHAAAYTALWLIPAILLCVNTRNVFVNALISTFVTHAVGSVIWLYFFVSLSAEQWLALMPIALVERIIFASGITICYYSMHTLYRWIVIRSSYFFNTSRV